MTMHAKILTTMGVVVMAAGAGLFAQSGDATKVMADMRQALGGEQKLAAVKSLTAVGKNDRAMGERSISGEYEMALELPDRFVTKQVLTSTPMGNVSMTVGFNGASLIQDTEMPQAPGGGGMRIQIGSASPNATPEERKTAADRTILQQRQELARMALGVFGNALPAFPLQFSYAGVAEAPDGKADIIDVKGEGDFAGKLFVDQKSHLPLMFSWMAKEPIQMTQSMGARSGGAPAVGSNMTFTRSSGAQAMTPEERDKMAKAMQEQMAAAEATRKTVEFRVYYGDFQDVDGLHLPHSFQQSVAGNASTEITIEKYKVNPKIDPKRFEVKK